MELRGKKVLITGGSKGIGLACAQGFAAEGAIPSGTIVTIDCGASLRARA